MSQLEQAMEGWLIKNGVPRFTHSYSNRKTLVNVLIAVIAVELGALAWHDLPWLAVIAAPAFIAVMWFLGEVTWKRVAKEAFPLWRKVGWVVLFLLFLSAAVIVLTSLGFVGLESWPTDITDTAVLLVFLHAAYAYWSKRRLGELARADRSLLVTLVLAVLLLVLKESLWPAVSENFLFPVPQGVLALALAIVVFAEVRRIPHECDLTALGGRVAGMCKAIPALILVLCVQAALLPYFFSLPLWVRMTLPLGAVAILLAITASRNNSLQSQESKGSESALISTRWAWAVYLVAYPLAVIAVSELGFVPEFGSVEFLGIRLVGVSAATFALALNLIYLLLAVGLSSIAPVTIGRWAVQQAWAERSDILRGLAAHLPLILVFAFFFLLTAETWEIAVETESGREWEFWLLVCALFLAGLGLLAWDTELSIREARTFGGKSVDSALSGIGTTRLRPLPRGVLRLAKEHAASDGQARIKLTLLRRLNAYVIMGTYQALIIVPMAVVTAIVFWMVGEAAVAPEVAATWISGDNADSDPQLARDLNSGCLDRRIAHCW